MDTITFNPYDLVVYEGISKKSGKAYRILQLSRDVAFNPPLIEKLIAQGVKIVKSGDTP